MNKHCNETQKPEVDESLDFARHKKGLLTEEGIEKAVAQGIKDWDDAFQLCDKEGAVIPEDTEHFVRRAIAKAQLEACRLDEGKVITLCGSTRFTHEMLIRQWELTKQGNIVLSWCALPDDYFEGDDKTHIGDKEGVKEIVDEVHMRKIDLSGRVHIMNIGGYIGEGTANEIRYAKSKGKVITYEEP